MTVSWQEYFPLLETKCACELGVSSTFQSVATPLAEQREKRSSESMVTSKEVVETPQ